MRRRDFIIGGGQVDGQGAMLPAAELREDLWPQHLLAQELPQPFEQRRGSARHRLAVPQQAAGMSPDEPPRVEQSFPKRSGPDRGTRSGGSRAAHRPHRPGATSPLSAQGGSRLAVQSPSGRSVEVGDHRIIAHPAPRRNGPSLRVVAVGVKRWSIAAAECHESIGTTKNTNRSKGLARNGFGTAPRQL